MNARALAIRSIAVALGALALTVAPLRAQDVAASATPVVSVDATPVATPATAAVAGPSLEAASVGAHAAAPATPAMPMATRNEDQGMKLMILGGAAILTGIVVGGNPGYAISVGGAVVGLYGLYKYLQ
ncbi:MAG: hypothetical protein ABIY52_08485 [Gemmatimonadaceae bacterium]